MVSGFYIGLALKAALIVVIQAVRDERSAVLRERSDSARRAKCRRGPFDRISGPDEKIRTVQGEIL
jgi:hypothetical protein